MYFREEYSFLSNFYPCNITIKLFDKEYRFPCAEAAFQACKCRNEEDVKQFTSLGGPSAKSVGRTVALRDNWDKDRVTAMTTVIGCKFHQNPNLEKKTGNNNKNNTSEI